MPTTSTIRGAAIGIALFIFLAIISALISANVRQLAAETGWDRYFLRAWQALPDQIRNMLSGWQPLRQKWWLWLILGFSSGVAVALTTVSQRGHGPFVFDYRPPYIQTPHERAQIDDTGWRFSIGFTFDKKLIKANAIIVSVSQKVAGKWERLIASNEEAKIGWDDYALSHDPRDLAADNEQQIVLFHYWGTDTSLDMFIKRVEGEFKKYHSIQPGEYRLVIRIDSQTFENENVVGRVHLWWCGNPESIRIEPEEYTKE